MASRKTISTRSMAALDKSPPTAPVTRDTNGASRESIGSLQDIARDRDRQSVERSRSLSENG